MAFLSQALHLGSLLLPHDAFQEHAAHPAEWSAALNSNGSERTCIRSGLATFLHCACTAHPDEVVRTASDNPSQEVSGRAPRHHCVGNAWASDQADQALGGVCCLRFFSLLGWTGQGGHVTGTGRANASRRSGVICQGRNALRSVGL